MQNEEKKDILEVTRLGIKKKRKEGRMNENLRGRKEERIGSRMRRGKKTLEVTHLGIKKKKKEGRKNEIKPKREREERNIKTDIQGGEGETKWRMKVTYMINEEGVKTKI